ncbi:glycosyltransferase family 4 protein [Candidatus Pacearchaeota archaeon]|nr:glycosyltransferase family 4 protein [Candidatus Pacearchaeota archaeon]
MKNIRVYLQYPLKVSDSQYYRSMIDNPPKGIEFVGSKKTGMVVNTRKFRGFDNFKKIIRTFLERIPLPIPNARYTNGSSFDLIHCAHCLSLNKSPWVADIESVYQMWGGVSATKSRISMTRKIVMSRHCKKIIAWTEATKKSIVEIFPEIADKVEVVYYAMPEMKPMKKKKGKDIVLFFSGRHFEAKGGVHATEVMDRLTKKYPNVKGVINGAIPEDVIKKYSRNKKLKFYQLMPYKDVLKLYQRADIFVYPGYSDTFGFVYMEAMAFGVPIVTVDGHSRREIVEDEKQGFVVDRPTQMMAKYLGADEDVVDDIEKKVGILIKDSKLRKKMGINCLREIKSGKFSLRRRNAQLKRIYGEALK